VIVVKKWIRSVVELFAPFTAIAQELRTLRELYELDLASRNPPIIRVTEAPSKGDTTVLYGEEPEEKGKLREMLDAWNESED
jgi:hypothetical protein